MKTIFKSEIFKNKNFMILTFGRMTSMFGTNVQNLSLSLYVMALTKSATAFASVLVVSSLPRLIEKIMSEESIFRKGT